MNKKDLINALSAKLQKDKKNLLRTAKRRNLYYIYSMKFTKETPEPRPNQWFEFRCSLSRIRPIRHISLYIQTFAKNTFYEG